MRCDASMTDTVTRAAKESLGSAGTSEWLLDPQAHASHFTPAAEPLRHVLGNAEIAAIVTEYRAADQAAIEAQAAYRRWSKAGSLCRFLSIFFGASALLKVAHGVNFAHLVSIGVGLQYALICAALVCSAYLSRRQPLARWMRERARAENLRLKLFNAVVEGEAPASTGALPLLPLKLEYFRRYQLDVQRDYYRRRGLQHARAAGQTMRWQVATLALTGIAIIPAALGFLDAWSGGTLPAALKPVSDFAFQDAGKIMLLAAGIVSSALGDLLAAQSLSSLDQRNATRYSSNANNLDYLAATDLPVAQAAAVSGDELQVRAFVDAVQGCVSSEHREWLHVRDLAKALSMERSAKFKRNIWSDGQRE